MIDTVVFYLFAALAAGSALVVVGQRNPLYSALALIVTMGIIVLVIVLAILLPIFELNQLVG